MVAEEPVVQLPLVQEPVVQPPLVQEPVIQPPLAQEPFAQETVAEKTIDSETAARPEGYTTHAAPILKTTFFVPGHETPRRRLFIRGGYLDAKYDRLESDLKNGATLFGFSASQVFSNVEVRLGVDVAHGLDQAVNLRNTRMAMFRAEGLYSLFSNEIVEGYLGSALGLANIDVTSDRSAGTNGDVTVRENATGTALLGAPEIGSRLRISRDISFDLTLQYLFLAGGSQISNLGGLLGEAALGFSF